MIKNTLYAKYIAERAGREVLENAFGFVTYKITGEECFICDMYVEPSNRRQSIASDFVDYLSEIARAKGCKTLTANIHLDDPGASNTLIAALLIGFSVVKAEFGTLLILKDIGGVNG